MTTTTSTTTNTTTILSGTEQNNCNQLLSLLIRFRCFNSLLFRICPKGSLILLVHVAVIVVQQLHNMFTNVRENLFLCLLAKIKYSTTLSHYSHHTAKISVNLLETFIYISLVRPYNSAFLHLLEGAKTVHPPWSRHVAATSISLVDNYSTMACIIHNQNSTIDWYMNIHGFGRINMGQEIECKDEFEQNDGICQETTFKTTITT